MSLVFFLRPRNSDFTTATQKADGGGAHQWCVPALLCLPSLSWRFSERALDGRTAATSSAQSPPLPPPPPPPPRDPRARGPMVSQLSAGAVGNCIDPSRRRTISPSLEWLSPRVVCEIVKENRIRDFGTSSVHRQIAWLASKFGFIRTHHRRTSRSQH